MRVISFLLSLCLFSALAFGQGANGTITGTVVDSSGAVLANAPVEARNTATGAVSSGVSTETGNYTILQLPVGTYDLTVTSAGFKTYTRQGLDLAAAQIMRIDVTMQVGSNTESVTVTADASLLKTENSELAHNVTVDQMTNLPILSVGGAGSAASSGFRDPFALAQMIPGVNYGANATMVINGVPDDTIQVRVEGQTAGNLGGLRQYTGQTQPSVDAVQEVAVQTSNFAAEFGTVGGGIFNVSMKSGTNQYHGSAYNYMNNEAINAHQPYTGLRTGQHRYDYGFTFGGPVTIPKVYDGKNKTFFFLSFEQFREKLRVATTTATVPTADYRTGDFSALIPASGLNGVARNLQVGGRDFIDPLGRTVKAGTIYDPRTTRSVTCVSTGGVGQPNCTNGQTVIVRDPFPGNVIPAQLFDPVALKILGLVPLPKGINSQNGQLGNNYQNAWLSSRVSNLPSLKLDQTVKDNGRLSFYWSTTGTTAQYSFPNGNAEGLPEPITGARGTFIYSQTIRLNYDHTLSPTTILHFGAGWSALSFDDHAPVLDYDPLTQLGLPRGTIIRQFPSFITSASAATGGMSALGPAAGIQAHSYERRPSGNVNIASVRGNHTMKLGAEYRLEKYPNYQFTNDAGSYTFGTNTTLQPALQGFTPTNGATGFAFADFLLGNLSNATLATPLAASTSKSQWALFVQDSWKVTRKLTLDLGLRWDYGTYAKEQYGRYSNFSPNTPNPSANGRLGAQVFEATCNCNFASNYPYAIGPRFGFAYQIDSKTVVRGGFGVVYTATSTASGSASVSASTSAAGFGESVGQLRNGIPADVQPQFPSFAANVGQPNGAVVTAPTFLDPNAGRPARQYQWSIGLQREINRNLVIEGSYVANRGVWWPAPALAPLNALSRETLARYGFTNFTSASESALLTTTIANLSTAQRNTLAARGITLPYGNFPTNQTVRQSLEPFPQYTVTVPANTVAYSAANGIGIQPAGAPLGKTWYDAIQINLTQRFSHGLTMNANYTYSKNLDLMNSPDPFNRQLGKDLSANDLPQQFRLTAEYQVPLLSKSKMAVLSNRYVSSVFSGWGIGIFLQYQSAPALARPNSSGTLPISNFLGYGPGAAQLKLDADGHYMNPYAVNWTDYEGKVHSEPLDINCHCFDPTKTVVFNPAAWQDVPNGQIGAQQSTIRQYRGIRYPQENANLSRNFRITEKVTLHIRAEFQNVFNRTRLPQPVTNGYQTLPSTFPSGANASLYSAGFGTVLPTSGTQGQRSGTLIGRITF